MQRLYFECPKTGKDVDVGIESELNTLLLIRSKKVRALCPCCQDWHEWQVADAQLGRTAA